MKRVSNGSPLAANKALAGSRVVSHGRSRKGEESLDLFARIQRSQLAAGRNEYVGQRSAVPDKSKRISIGKGTLGRNGVDDLLSSDAGKHDYDWLMTPPGSPHFPSSKANENNLSPAFPRGSSRIRSVSAVKPSRLSMSKPEERHATRSVRSSSSMHSSSISSTSTTTSSHLSKRKTSIPSSSSSSVTSKPSTPSKRSVAQTTARTPIAAPTSRPVPSRLSSPARTHQTPISTAEKTKLIKNSTPNTYTPTVRPRTSSTAPTPRPSTPASRSDSRRSTPTRRPSTPAATLTTNRPASAGRILDRRMKQQELHQRSSVHLSSNSNAGAQASSKLQRSLSSSSIVTRSRLHESALKTQLHGSRTKASTESVSKRSLDVALKHMDIRKDTGGIPRASLYPRIVRSNHIPDKVVPTNDDDGSPEIAALKNGDANSTRKDAIMARLTKLDNYESLRYDVMLLKENSENMNWLHSIEGKRDESPLFQRFEQLPEPFGPL